MQDLQGVLSWSVPVRVAVESQVMRSALDAPFWSSSDDRLQIRYRIGPTSQNSRLAIYDVRGRQLRVLARGPHAPGAYLRTWDGRDTSGHAVARGVYIVRLEAGHASLSHKIVLLRP
jgi:flagellar hook assembly protein FlgD